MTFGVGRRGAGSGRPASRLAATLLVAAGLLLGAPPSAAAQADAPSTHPAATEGITAGEMAAIDELLEAMEAGLRAEDGEALGRLFHARGRLSDWRGRLARGPDRVTAAYREAFRAYRSTTSFRLDDGREVRLQRSPPVATEVRFSMDMVRELGDTAAVVDGDWRTSGGLAPTGAPLAGEESLQGEGGPPYAGAYRLVAVLSGERASIGLLHLDPYHATVEPEPDPGPEPAPPPEPGTPPRDPDAPAPAGEAPPPSSAVYFGTTYTNYARRSLRMDGCIIHPDGAVTAAPWSPEWAQIGETVGDTLGRLPADSVARYTELVREGVAPEPGPIESGSADFGTVSFWVAAPERDGGSWRVELASGGDVPRRPSSPETRRLALWIYASLGAVQDGECTLVPPVSRDALGRR